MVIYNSEKTGTLLSLLRQQKGLSQEQMAETLHVSYRTFRRWESGESTPSMGDIANCCNYFNISLEEFFKGEISIAKSIKRTVNESANRISEKLPFFRGRQAAKIYYYVCLSLFLLFLVTGIYHFAWYIGIASTTGQSREFYLNAFSASAVLALVFRILSILLLNSTDQGVNETNKN